MSVRIPHLSLPFRIVDGAAAVNEQDSVEEIVDCVEAILRCPQGHRVELPDFGLADQAFAQSGADPQIVEATVNRWEPRTRTIATVNPDALKDAISRVLVQTDAPATVAA